MTTSISVGTKWTLEQANMLTMMIEHTKERNEGWEILLVDMFPALTSIHVPTIIGLFSWSSRAVKKRLLLKSHAVDYGGGWCTPGDVARDYLALKFPKRRVRMTTSQYQKIVPNRAQTPVYCEPGDLENGVYIDIQHAYWSIVRTLGWDVNYNPGVFLSPQSDVADFPFPDLKMARNCLVSCGLSGMLRLWTGEKLIFQKKPNRFINLMLWKAAQDILHGVALDCIDAGAIYAYTDGFIAPQEKAAKVFAAIEAWGLTAGVKHDGLAHVRGPADYDFPGYRTKVRPRNKAIKFSNLYEPGRDWLRWRVKKFADASIVF